MLRENDYELWIDINEEGKYDLHNEINLFLKPKDLLLISKSLEKQKDKIHKLIIGKNIFLKND
jgi:hypothetical protein